METQDWGTGYIDKDLWNESYQHLNYTKQPFNNRRDMIRWRREGYNHPAEMFTGYMCDMQQPLPDWHSSIITWFEREHNLNDVGLSFYRMTTGTILPRHGDTYKRYRELFGCRLDQIFRAVVFLSDWKSGHYFEIAETPAVSWSAGDYAWWRGDTPHMAANIGLEDRYTLQVTGWIDDTQ